MLREIITNKIVFHNYVSREVSPDYFEPTDVIYVHRDSHNCGTFINKHVTIYIATYMLLFTIHTHNGFLFINIYVNIYLYTYI